MPLNTQPSAENLKLDRLERTSQTHTLNKPDRLKKGFLARMRNTVGRLSREAESEVLASAHALPDSIRAIIRQVDTVHSDLKALLMNEILKMGASSKSVAKAALPLVAVSYLTACGAQPNVVANFTEQLKGYETRLNSTEMLLRSAQGQIERQQAEMTILVNMITSIQAEGEVSKKTIDDIRKIMSDFRAEITNNTASFEEAKEHVLQKIATIEDLTSQQQAIFSTALEAVSTAGLMQEAPSEYSSFSTVPEELMEEYDLPKEFLEDEKEQELNENTVEANQTESIEETSSQKAEMESLSEEEKETPLDAPKPPLNLPPFPQS